MTDLRPSGPARTGELLDGRYRFEALIGDGGMASVWRASDEALERTVAIKMFWMDPTEVADAMRRESEKRLLASLSHPSLVTLFDAKLSESERSYLVMEHIDGGTLADLISHGPVSTADVALLAADLGEALHVVHEAGIVHRDVKPANVLLRPLLPPQHRFRAVLADFGIAYLIDTARVTTPGIAVGTAAYIAPEQARGHGPTSASDIYSLGLVLLEALTGKRAFPQRDSAEAVAARLSAPPIIPGDWGYGWRSLLTAMTSLDPDERPSALEVATRARALDAGSAEFDAPGLTTVDLTMSAEPADGMTTARGATYQTRVLPPAATSPSGRIRGSQSDKPAEDRLRPVAVERSPRRRLKGMVLAAVFAVAAAVLVVFVWNGISTAPAVPPELPQVEEPLGTHLRDLMREVSP